MRPSNVAFILKQRLDPAIGVHPAIRLHDIQPKRRTGAYEQIAVEYISRNRCGLFVWHKSFSFDSVTAWGLPADYLSALDLAVEHKFNAF